MVSSLTANVADLIALDIYVSISMVARVNFMMTLQGSL